jgi:AcrR family transcriptional regulator
MRAIAQQLGFSAPAIYNYFLSKEEIFLALQERGLQLLADAVLQPATDDPLRDLKAIYERYYQFTKTHPEYFTLLYVDPSTPHLNTAFEPLTRMETETASRVRRCVEQGVFPPEATSFISGLLWSTVHGAAVLRQIQEIAPMNFDMLAMAGVDVTIAAIRGGILPNRS